MCALVLHSPDVQPVLGLVYCCRTFTFFTTVCPPCLRVWRCAKKSARGLKTPTELGASIPPRIGFVNPLRYAWGCNSFRKVLIHTLGGGCNTQQIGSTLRSAAAILLPPRNYCGEAGEAGSAI